MGRTPLHDAALWSHTHVVRLLLAAGASPTVKDKSGKTPVELAEQEATKRLLNNPEEAKQAECVVQ